MKTPTDLAQTFQALADPTRLVILNLLRTGERSATELIEALRMSQPRVARHLKILVDARLLTARRDGRFVRYAVTGTGEEGALAAAALGVMAAVAARNPATPGLGPALPQREAPVGGAEPAEAPDDPSDRPGPIEDFLL